MRAVDFEYAGFNYIIFLRSNGEIFSVMPAQGQHKAAAKDKHRQAVRELYEESLCQA